MNTSQPQRRNSHRLNTWNGGKDTKGKTIGSCIALIADDCKVMKLSQDVKEKSKFSYAFHHLPNRVGKERPTVSLKEDYYKDNANDPKKKERMIKQLEELLNGPDLR